MYELCLDLKLININICSLFFFNFFYKTEDAVLKIKH